jgi:hypothetical protein
VTRCGRDIREPPGKPARLEDRIDGRRDRLVDRQPVRGRGHRLLERAKGRRRAVGIPFDNEPSQYPLRPQLQRTLRVQYNHGEGASDRSGDPGVLPDHRIAPRREEQHVLKRVRVRVVIDPIAQPHTQGRVRIRASGAIDLAIGVEWFKEPVAQLLQLVVKINQGDLDLGVVGTGGCQTTGAPDRIAVGFPGSGGVGRRASATVRIRWRCRRNLAPLPDVGQHRLQTDRSRVQQPAERRDHVTAASPRDTGEQGVCAGAKVEMVPSSKILQSQARDTHRRPP